MNLYLITLGEDRPSYNHVKSFVVPAESEHEAVYGYLTRISLWKIINGYDYDDEYGELESQMISYGMPLTESEQRSFFVRGSNTYTAEIIGTYAGTEETRRVLCANYYMG